MPKILVTGFKPFLGHSENPSEMLALDLKKKYSEIEALILPVEFGRAFETLQEWLKSQKFDFILLLGQAAGRSQISLEKIALNWVETSRKDESGRQLPPGPIVKDEELALMTGFPVNELYEYLKSKKHPVHISFSAGTYVCNETYYRVLRAGLSSGTLFIHVPQLPEQKPEIQANSMSYQLQLQVLTEAVEYLLKKN